MKDFITHDLARHSLTCKGCMEQVEIPTRVRNARMPQEAVLIYKQEFAAKHIADGCDEAAERVQQASWSSRVRTLNPALSALTRAQHMIQ